LSYRVDKIVAIDIQHNLTPSVAQFDAKAHQRIVLKEVGNPIHDEESITTVFQAARDTAEGEYR